jgi:hypothetical protein
MDVERREALAHRQRVHFLRENRGGFLCQIREAFNSVNYRVRKWFRVLISLCCCLISGGGGGRETHRPRVKSAESGRKMTESLECAAA